MVDVTRIGSLSATGQVKARLFAGWPRDRYLQVFSTKARIGVCSGGGETRTTVTKEQLISLVEAFMPEVIYARPVGTPESFTTLTWELLDRYSDVPVVTHVMDDWLERLRVSDPDGAATADSALRRLIERSVARFSISPEMSAEMSYRYGRRFEPFANCVDLFEIRPHSQEHDGPVRFRYSGGFAADQTRDSIIDIAQAVEEVALSRPIVFEVSVLRPWFDDANRALSGYSRTKVQVATRDWEQYTAFLREADVGVIAYNFDETTRAYVQFSQANKLPEYMAAGLPILAYGPKDFATIARCRESGAASLVTQRDPEALRTGIERLARDDDVRRDLSRLSRSFAEERFDDSQVREAFQRRVIAASIPRPRQREFALDHELSNLGVAAVPMGRPDRKRKVQTKSWRAVRRAPERSGYRLMSQRTQKRVLITKRLLSFLPRWLVDLIPRERRNRWRRSLLRLEKRIRRADKAEARPKRWPLSSTSGTKRMASRVDGVEARLDEILKRLDQLDSRISMSVSGPSPSPVDDLRDLVGPVQELLERLNELRTDQDLGGAPAEDDVA